MSNRDSGGGPISCRNVFKIQRSNAIFFLTLIRSNLLISSPQREYFAVEIFFAGSPFPRNSTRCTRRFFPAMLLLIYDSAYYSQLRTQACRVIARRVTRRMHPMGVASNVEAAEGGGRGGIKLVGFSFEGQNERHNETLREKSARISDPSSNFLENKIRYSITRIDRLISLRPVDCDCECLSSIFRVFELMEKDRYNRDRYIAAFVHPFRNNFNNTSGT